MMERKKALPPRYLLIFIVIILLLHFLFPITHLINYPWMLLGCIPLFLGIGLNIIADRAFKIVNTTVKPFEESAVFITDGIYGFSRHPMYLGMVLIILGIAILTGSLSPLLAIPVFIYLLETKFIRVEEKMLEEKFGETWLEYKAKVRKWI